MVEQDRRTNVRDLASNSGLSNGTVHAILHDDLGLRKKVIRWAQRLLSDERKQKHLRMARDIKKSAFHQGQRFLKSVIILDETFLFARVEKDVVSVASSVQQSPEKGEG